MDHTQVKKDWELKLKADFQHADALLGFLTHTMDSFAYRYMTDPQITVQGNVLMMEGREYNMGQALKTANAEIKEAVKQLAKNVPREARPALVSRVKIDLIELTADKGKIVLTAQVNWAHPDYLWKTSEGISKNKTFVWDDLQVFRKGFPLALEDVCDLFL